MVASLAPPPSPVADDGEVSEFRSGTPAERRLDQAPLQDRLGESRRSDDRRAVYRTDPAETAVRVSQTLVQTLGPKAGRLTVEACDGMITVRGRVSSYYAKQVVTHVALPVAGRGRLKNDCHVG